MSILIKGMEMPTSCYKCPLRRRDGMDIVCPVAHERFSVADVNILDYRLDNCPLVPVPPHGRLIDADNLALLVLNLISTQEKAYPYEDSNALAWRLGAKAMGNQIYRDIKAYPTIIPAEEGEHEL